MNKKTTIKYAVAAMLFAMGTQAHAQLLKGIIKGADAEEMEDAAINYSPDGYMLNAQVNDLKIQEDGTFTYDMDFEGDYADVEVLLGEEMLGAHLVKGKTVIMEIQNTDNGLVATYKGDEAKINNFVNVMKKAYDGMNYWSPDPAEAKTNAEYRAQLEEENNKVKKLLPTIKDKDLRAYYTKLADYSYRWAKLRLIMDNDEEGTGAYRNDPEFKAALADVDVNDPVAYASNLTLTKLFNSVKSTQGGSEEFCREVMKEIDEKITNKNIRRTMVVMTGQQYLMYGNGDDNSENFIKDLQAWAGEDANLLDGMIQQFRDKVESQKTTKFGTPCPDITLTDREGKTFQLLDIAKGKFTYIDVWATWCGPCKKEIPYVAKMVEKYKDSDKVQFVSISIDEDVDAWKKMIDADKPAWAQYNINGAVSEEFSKQWGITGIPRFLMIDKDGKIYNADASRPSDEETTEIIEDIIAE